MNLVLDRYEGNFAICENMESGEMINIDKELIPEGIREGTILILENNKVIVDNDETIKRSKAIKKKMKSLWE